MDINVEKAVKKDVIKWIKTLDDEKVLYILHDIKEHNREITPEEKQEFNRWLAALDYAPQLEMLRSIIASSPERDTIWKELSPAAQEQLRTDQEDETTDVQYTVEQFWELVSDLREGDKFSRHDLSEAEKKAIEQGLADGKAGRTIPHEDVMKEVEQWSNEMTLKQIKESIPDLPKDMRVEIADVVLETLNRSDKNP